MFPLFGASIAKMEETLGALMLLLFLSGVQGEYADLVCIPGVGNFSSKLTPQHYYQCDTHVRGKPQLMECPQGEKYVRKKQQCMEDTGAPEHEYISEKGLGRNIQLGSFYDARRGMFFPESSFWKRQTILDHEERYDRNAVSVSVTTDTLAKQKMEHLGITADLTLKFMGGFIKLHGSFGYIIDKVNVDNEVNAQLNFYTTKMRKVLPKQTTLDYRDQCDNADVTHAVSSVTYGLGAVFNFQRVYGDHEDRSAIEAGLSASIGILPGISISGGIDVYFNDTIIELLNSTSLKMFGDFSPADPSEATSEATLKPLLKPLPTTFVEAVTFFKSLPSFSGTAEDDWSGTTIMDVVMTPVQEYCADSGNIVDQISPDLTERLNEMFDSFDQLEMKNGGLLAREPALLYQPIRQNLNLYKTALQTYRLKVQKMLQEVLPNILGDPQLGEEELVQILQDYEKSRFWFETSQLFLVNRNREIQAVQYLIDLFPEETNIAIADYEMANDVEFIFKKEKVVVLEFNILTPKSLTQGFLDGIPVDESNFWFNDIESNARVGSVLRNLSDFALANANQEDRGYLVKLSLIEPEKEFVMSALIKGQLLSDEFVVPPKLTTPSADDIYDISHERFKFRIPKGNNFVTGCIVYVSDNIPGPNGTLPIVREIVQMFPDDLAADDVEIVAYNLSPAHVYSFNVRYLTEVGSSPSCLDYEGFYTAPVSPPNTLSAELVSSKMIKLSWTAPNVIAEYLHINKSLISYRIKLKDYYENITDDFEIELTNLEPGTEYIIEAMAFISKSITNGTQLPDSSPSIISVYTVPLPPQNFSPENVGEHSVDLIWDPPAKLIQAATLYYIVEYFSEGGATQQYVVKNAECKITNLARGTLYSFSVKVVTVGGASELSEELQVETMYIMTEFEKIKAELHDFLENVASEARAKSNFCAFKATTTTNQETITYDYVYLNDNNVNGASMDNSTGYFIAGASGSYQVMVSLEMTLAAGQDHNVWMVVNDETLEESRMSSANDILNVSPATDNGSRNIVLVLTAGDKVYLRHQTNGLQTLNSVTFCVSLIKI